MIKPEDKKIFFTAFLGMINLIFLSYLGYNYPWLESLGFLIIIILFIILTFRYLLLGFYLVLAELFLGSFGRLLSIDFFGYQLSLRIALFIIFFVIFSLWYLEKRVNLNLKDFVFKKIFILFLLAIFWTTLNGFFQNNHGIFIFYDMNAFLFLFYAFIFLAVLNKREIIKNIVIILGAAISVTLIINLNLFLLFAYQPPLDLVAIYKWFRDVRLGEVTLIFNNIYRIFSQAQIFSLIGFFVFFTIYSSKYFFKNNLLNDKKDYRVFFVFSLIANLSIIISFSRSFWLGFIGALILLLILLIDKYKLSFTTVSKIMVNLIFITLLNLAFLYLISGSFSPALIRGRFNNLLNEPASTSRLQQLGPLWQNIKNNLILGTGFGKTVTYNSTDPRILNEFPDGHYSTYAFEWGYLDLLLKFGIIGFIIYLALLWKILKRGGDLISNNLGHLDEILIIGLLGGFGALLITNIFSPYLNHPLGLGYLLLLMVIFNYYANEQKTIARH